MVFLYTMQPIQNPKPETWVIEDDGQIDTKRNVQGHMTSPPYKVSYMVELEFFCFLCVCVCSNSSSFASSSSSSSSLVLSVLLCLPFLSCEYIERESVLLT